MGWHHFYDLKTAPKQSFKEDQILPLVTMYNPPDSTGVLNAFFFTSPVPLPIRLSSSNLSQHQKATSPGKPSIHHKFKRKNAVPKSAIHSLARVRLKEFEEDELEQIKILGDVDVAKEIELRDEINKKIENQIVLHEKTLREMIQRHSIKITKIDTFESLRGSFDEEMTTGIDEI